MRDWSLMVMKKISAVLLAIVFSILMFPGLTTQANSEAQVVEEMKYIVKNYYYDKIPSNLNQLKTTKQIIDALDSHSFYMTKQEFLLYEALLGRGSVSQNVQNDAGTTDGLVNDMILGNAPISNGKASISSELIGNQTGLIKITTFPNNLSAKIEEQWLALQKQGATSLIVDLRDNGGGYIDSAQQLISFFPNARHAFYIQTRHNKELKPVVKTTVTFPKNTYILQNGGSASASEMVAVSARDQGLATIVGQKSFGKGSIQTFYRLSNEGVFRVTTGEFYGTANTKVNHIGVQPHIHTAQHEELLTAHKHIIEKNHTLLTPVQLSETAEGIQLKLPRKMNFSETKASHKIELIELGGKAIPATVDQLDFESATLQPTAALQKGKTYYAVIKPIVKRQNGKRLERGYVAQITVK